MQKSPYSYICYYSVAKKQKGFSPLFLHLPTIARHFGYKQEIPRENTACCCGWLRAWRVDDDGEKSGRRQEDDADLPAAALSQGTWDCQPASKRARQRSWKNSRCAF